MSFSEPVILSCEMCPSRLAIFLETSGFIFRHSYLASPCCERRLGVLHA